MKAFVAVIFLAAALIAGGFFVSKKKASESKINLEAESARLLEKVSKEVATTPKIKETTVPAQPMTEDAQKKYEQKLRSEGYVDNPQDPYTLIKRVKKNGKDVFYVMPKKQDEVRSLEPQERSKKTAEEILESKKGNNLEEEIGSLKRLDSNDEKTMMMLGHFRDEGKDLEIFFGPTSDMQDNPLPEDVLCLVSPKYSLNIKKNYNGVVRTDDTGYVVIKANDNIYARVAWSFENSRILHGQVYSMELGQPKLVTDFEAKEVSSDKPKYCR